MEIEGKTLYLVGTPIGNLQDITFRALEVLKKVDLIAAEDTRHTGKLLHYFQIETPQISYREHNEKQRTGDLVSRLQNGATIALVTDAGMPGISDPGYHLVCGCIAAGITIVPIPGVTAATTALCASGLPTDRFVFEGFLPVKGVERKTLLQEIGEEVRTMVLYESPHRLLATLADLARVCGDDREITIARELTKLYEEFWRGSIAAALQRHATISPQGEYTIVLAGKAAADPTVWDEATLKAELQTLLDSGRSLSQACRELARRNNLNRRDLYKLAIGSNGE
jgi:16S rRNA (cytidine1402-2'-O)-methyltransferase